MNEVKKEKVFSYLNELRESGIVNMFGAGSYIEKAFNVTKQEAREHLMLWMESFK